MPAWLKRAFAVDPPGPIKPTEEEQQIIDRLSRAIVRRGLAAPALMFLECSHPFNYVASQFLVFVAPVAQLIFDKSQYQILVKMLEKRGSIEAVCRRIEEFDAAPTQRAADEAERIDAE